jgi:hypothetical protein
LHRETPIFSQGAREHPVLTSCIYPAVASLNTGFVKEPKTISRSTHWCHFDRLVDYSPDWLILGFPTGSHPQCVFNACMALDLMQVTIQISNENLPPYLHPSGG